jgi:hypothetical protein
MEIGVSSTTANGENQETSRPPSDKVEMLAHELHKDYRAAFKAMHSGGLVHTSTAQGHDHGWMHCNRKNYFRKRAKGILDGKL